jgi:hypothetical protein
MLLRQTGRELSNSRAVIGSIQWLADAVGRGTRKWRVDSVIDAGSLRSNEGRPVPKN